MKKLGYFLIGLMLLTIVVTFFLPINSDVEFEECVKDVVNASFKKISSRGGYYVMIEKPSINNLTPYYLYNKTRYIPDLSFVESNIESAVENNYLRCIDKEIYALEEIKVSLEDGVSFTARYIKDLDKIQQFQTTIPLSFDFLDISVKVLDSFYDEDICLSCINRISNEFDAKIDFFDYQSSLIFSIIKDDVEWNFAVN